MFWHVARDYCRTHHTDLSSVRNEEEDQIIQEVAGRQHVWLGLFRDPWEWSDQTYSSFRYWKAGQKVGINLNKEGCVALLKSESGRWGELPCDEAHPFLCNCEQSSSFTFFILCFGVFHSCIAHMHFTLITVEYLLLEITRTNFETDISR